MTSAPDAPRARIVGLASQGPGSPDEDRLRSLCAHFDTDLVSVCRGSPAQRLRRMPATLRRLISSTHDLAVMEGTGVAAGVPILVARIATGRPYVLSTGDAVGPYVASQHAWAAPAFAVYERLLCRLSAGVIGWTPYIAGRALTFGAPRACTVEAWPPLAVPRGELRQRGRAVRARLAIPTDALVIGIVGSLAWSRRRSYCYGYELVAAARHIRRRDAHILIVGDGNGRKRLEALASTVSGRTVHFVGSVPRDEVPDYLGAIDIGSIPQSRDRLGSFRYSTKLSEYLAAGVPVVTGRLPLAYDLDTGWLWRLPGTAPWDAAYPMAIARLVDGLSREDLTAKRSAALEASARFDGVAQLERAAAFLSDVIDEVGHSRRNGRAPS